LSGFHLRSVDDLPSFRLRTALPNAVAGQVGGQVPPSLV
jgi:hypothetical protein